MTRNIALLVEAPHLSLNIPHEAVLVHHCVILLGAISIERVDLTIVAQVRHDLVYVDEFGAPLIHNLLNTLVLHWLWLPRGWRL